MGCMASKASAAAATPRIDGGEQPAKSLASAGAPARTLLASEPPARKSAALAGASPEPRRRQAAICQEAIDAKEAPHDENNVHAAFTAKRRSGRKSTPWMKPGDAKPLADDDEEDGEAEAAGFKRATICQEAIDLREDLEGSIAAKRRSGRKSTPWVKPGDAKPLADDDEEDGEAEAASAKRVTISEEVSNLRENHGESIAAKRSSSRKSTPWVKPGDAKRFTVASVADDDEDEDEVKDRKIAICQEAITQKSRSEDAAEDGVVVKRSRHRILTPWIKSGDVAHLDGDDDGEHAAKVATIAASICQQAVELKQASEAAVEEAASKRATIGSEAAFREIWSQALSK